MENNKNKKSVKFQGDMLNFCDFIQVFVFTRNHHLKKLCIGSMDATSMSCDLNHIYFDLIFVYDLGTCMSELYNYT